MEFSLDIQCFMRSSNILEVKELAIIPLLDVNIRPSVYLFKPPCPWKKLFTQEKKTCSYVQKFKHKIKWEDGEIPHQDVVKILHKNLQFSKKVYVKGLQKARFIENLIPNSPVINIEDMDSPTIKELVENTHLSCPNHHSDDYSCAGKIALGIKKFVIDKKYARLFRPENMEVDVVDYPWPPKEISDEILLSMYT